MLIAHYGDDFCTKKRYDMVRLFIQYVLQSIHSSHNADDVCDAMLEDCRRLVEKAAGFDEDLLSWLEEAGRDNALWRTTLEEKLFPALNEIIIGDLCDLLDDKATSLKIDPPRPRVYREFVFQVNSPLWRSNQWIGKLFDATEKDKIGDKALKVLETCAITGSEELAREMAGNRDLIRKLWAAATLTYTDVMSRGFLRLSTRLVERGADESDLVLPPSS